MIDQKDLARCKSLCREFLARAEEWEKAAKLEKENNEAFRLGKEPHWGRRLSSVAEHAALIRISLDLWRALAFMRRRK